MSKKDLKADVRGRSWTMSILHYEVSLDLRNDAKAPIIRSELLRAPAECDGMRHTFSLKRSKDKVLICDPMRNGSEDEEIDVPKGESTRLALGVGFFALPCVALREEINGWRFYNINPAVAREPYRETPEPELGAAGENLAVVLHKIEGAKNGKDLAAIVSGLRGVVPGFKRLRTKKLPTEAKWAFQILEEKIRGATNPDSVSDGTIRLLILLVITTWMARRSSLIAIEEPENGIHPHLSEHVIDILRQAPSQTQFLAATHNPDFLDSLEPDEVILCDKEEGFTRVKRASDVKEIEQFRKHFRLGELWVQGRLGGVI